MPRITEPTSQAIEQAAAALRDGRAVAFPTETVYGLGAATMNAAGLKELRRLKNRPADSPLSALVADVDAARELTRSWDDRADELARRFWPGPLTMVLPKAENLPDVDVSGGNTIGVRIPRHPVAEELLRVFGSPVSTSSANRSGRLSPTTAAHVAAEFADVKDLVILDGGRCEIGLESTVLDLTQDVPRILRPGSVPLTDLTDAIGDVDTSASEPGFSEAQFPGAHYVPSTPTELVGSSDLVARIDGLVSPAAVLCFDAQAVAPPHRSILMPQGAGDYARVMYDALREADGMGMKLILIERPPTSNDLWKAIENRLLAAAKLT